MSLAARLIPAHAGKTTINADNAPAIEAHPRSRGENNVAGIGVASPGGSSPLTRGKHMLPSWKGPEDRLIPAHAGKTMGVVETRPGTAAHPRSRGENR